MMWLSPWLAETENFAAALRLLEEAGNLLWKIFSRVLGTVIGVTVTTIFQAWLLVRLFPSFV